MPNASIVERYSSYANLPGVTQISQKQTARKIEVGRPYVRALDGRGWGRGGWGLAPPGVVFVFMYILYSYPDVSHSQSYSYARLGYSRHYSRASSVCSSQRMAVITRLGYSRHYSSVSSVCSSQRMAVITARLLPTL